jgi:hypothetical protein
VTGFFFSQRLIQLITTSPFEGWQRSACQQ